MAITVKPMGALVIPNRSGFIQPDEHVVANLQPKEKMDGAKGNPESVVYKPKDSFTNKQLRGEIFRGSKKRMRPDVKYINRYKKFLSEKYAEAVQKQLRRSGRKSTDGVRSRYSNLGYATGALQKSVYATAKVNIIHDPNIGKVHIDYELKSHHEEYGDYIAAGRRAGWINRQALIMWIEAKIALRSFTLYKVFREKGRPTGKKAQSRKATITSIAIAISNKAKKAPKPPVLKDWSSWDGNVRLQTMFNESVRKKGGYYRTQIRKSIVKNLKVQYGNTNH